jgi:hypothetical protein
MGSSYGTDISITSGVGFNFLRLSPARFHSTIWDNLQYNYQSRTIIQGILVASKESLCELALMMFYEGDETTRNWKTE